MVIFPLGLQLSVNIVSDRGPWDWPRVPNWGEWVPMAIEAHPEGATTPGIRVTVVGIGGDPASAARDAAHQWAIGVLPALVSYVLQRREVALDWLLVQDDETGQRFGWTLHMGEVITRAFGTDDTGWQPERVAPKQALTPLLDALTDFSAHDNLMWLESYASRHADSTVSATCRLRNDDWPEGVAALSRWAASWSDTRGHALSRRQFVMLEPTPVSGLSHDLREGMNRATGKH